MSGNIDDFNENVGAVFALLYQHFPVRIIIDESHVILKENDLEQEEDWLSRVGRRRAIYISTMEWLIDAGYIWVGERDQVYGIYKECVLTVKGLETLSIVPSSLSASIGTKLSEAATAASKEGLKEFGKQAVSAGAAMVIGYVKTHIPGFPMPSQ